ncbi:MAG: right-handed parallel beta-helix repeat-containing protein [Acidobacteria bacterium]|nr:right-handed parallel beta-helix repeat-containing protein [Acidobacteriota bacterium]
MHVESDNGELTARTGRTRRQWASTPQGGRTAAQPPRRDAGFGIFGHATGNVVDGNYVGVAVEPTIRGLGNFAGVQIRSDGNIARNNLIGGNEDSGVLIFDGASSNNLVQGNTLAYNSQDGVSVFAGTGNTIVGNAIYANRCSG